MNRLCVRPMNRWILRINPLLIIFSLLGCRGYTVLAGKPSLTLTNQTLERDTLLRGRVVIEGVLRVPSGVRLQVAPGTTVVFKGDPRKKNDPGGILVEGIFEAVGKPGRRIRFVSADDRRWGEILINESPGSVIRYADFDRASWGLHLHFTHTEVSHCSFKHGTGGIRFGSGPVIIKNNIFEDNRTAIRYIISDPVIQGNTFARQRVAVFVRGGSSNSRINKNNFLNSAEFHIKLGEEQTADVKAAGNWWGTLERGRIDRLLYDKRDSENLGRVMIKPLAEKPQGFVSQIPHQALSRPGHGGEVLP